MARPGIMLYFDILEPIRVLSDSDKGLLLVAMLEYGRDGIVPEFDGMLALAWGFVKPKLDRDGETYENAKIQRKYAAFCKQRTALNLPKIPFEEWLDMTDIERKQFLTIDYEPQRPVDSVESRYPTTAAAVSPTVFPTVSITAVAAGTEPADDSSATTAVEDRQLKMLQGELGKGVVALTDNQIAVLLEDMGLEMFDFYVDKLSSFIIKKGAKVKSHYDTIRKWWIEDSQA